LYTSGLSLLSLETIVLKTNLIDHPKIKHNRLKKRKWLRLRNTVPQRLSEYGSLLPADKCVSFATENPLLYTYPGFIRSPFSFSVIKI